jgi:hypothetical protein
MGKHNRIPLVSGLNQFLGHVLRGLDFIKFENIGGKLQEISM